MRKTSSLVWLGLLPLLAGCVLSVGCVPSLHPLYTDNDLVFVESLVGTWRVYDSEDEDTWTFESGEAKAYQVTIMDEGKPGRFQGHLAKLGDHLFLDLLPEPMEPDEGEKVSSFWAFHFVRVHTFSRLQLTGDRLEIAFMDPDALSSGITQGKVQIAHEEVEDTIILTAPTKDLQALVLRYAEAPAPSPAEGTRVLGEPGRLDRQR